MGMLTRNTKGNYIDIEARNKAEHIYGYAHTDHKKFEEEIDKVNRLAKTDPYMYEGIMQFLAEYIEQDKALQINQ